jgi:hypothetical protein
MTLWLLLSILLTQGLSREPDSGVITGTVRHPDGRPAAGVLRRCLLAKTGRQ